MGLWETSTRGKVLSICELRFISIGQAILGTIGLLVMLCQIMCQM
jgi:hypothetical protein